MNLHLASFVVVLAAACSAPPAAGRSCGASEAPVCADPQSALVCRDGFWAAKACIDGCQKGDGGTTCVGVGDACQSVGFGCLDAVDAAECTKGAWRALPCRGPKGCVKTSGVVTCDISADVEGDACASTAEGKGFCRADGRAVVECQSGVILKANDCGACTVSGDQVICNP